MHRLSRVFTRLGAGTAIVAVALASGPAHAGWVRAQARSSTRIYQIQGGKPVPLQGVSAGDSLTVFDPPRGPWRYIVVPGSSPAKTAWIPDRDVELGSGGSSSSYASSGLKGFSVLLDLAAAMPAPSDIQSAVDIKPQRLLRMIVSAEGAYKVAPKIPVFLRASYYSLGDSAGTSGFSLSLISLSAGAAYEILEQQKTKFGAAAAFGTPIITSFSITSGGTTESRDLGSRLYFADPRVYGEYALTRTMSFEAELGYQLYFSSATGASNVDTPYLGLGVRMAF